MAGKELVIKISGDVDNYKASLNEAEEATEGLNATLGQVSLAGGAALFALSAGVMKTVDALNIEARALDEVTLALQNQGLYSDELFESYRRVADAIEDKTGVDADAISSAQASTQAIIGQIALTDDLTRATVDFAAGSKQDLSGAFDAVAKGINGNIKGLKQYGIELADGLTKQQRMDAIAEQLKQKYDGQAESIAKATGSTVLFSSAVGNLEKELGRRFAPTFDLVVGALTTFITKIKDNGPLLDFIASVTAGGIAFGASALAIAGLIKAYEVYRLVVAAATVTTGISNIMLGVGTAGAARSATLSIGALIVALRGASLATKALVGATGIGLLVIIASEIYLNWSTIFPRLQAIYKGFVETIFALGGPLGDFWEAMKNFDGAGMKKAGQDAFALFKEGFKTATAPLDTPPVEAGGVQDPNKAGAAGSRTIASKEQLAREEATKQAQLEAMLLTEAGASKELIDLKKEEAATLAQIEDDKNTAIRGLLEQHLEQNREQQIAQIDLDKERRLILQEEILAENEAFQQMSYEQKLRFMQQNQQLLETQILTEKTARDKAAADQAKLEIESRNRFLLDQQKFGIVYATINKAMHSAIYQGSKQAFGELAELTQSSNATLKGIGKAAAIANIIIKTAESAMNIYNGFSAIPIVGIGLGIAGAAAAVAFGAEKVSQVNAAANGALVEGGIPGVDSVPFMLQRQELVVPRTSFEDVIGSTRAAREAERFLPQGGSDNGAILSEISAKLDNVGGGGSVVIQGDVLADEAFIDRLLEKVSDRLMNGNGKLLIPGVTA